MGKALGGFKSHVVRRLKGRLPRRTTDGKWKKTLAMTEREEAGFLTMEEYIQRHQNTVAQYIATPSLLDLCDWSKRAPGVRVRMRWWEQAGLNLEGARKAAEAYERDGVEE